jgi:hypothetical protein
VIGHASLRSVAVGLLVTAGLTGCATDQDKRLGQEAREEHVKCVLESCNRVGRTGRAPEEALRSYPLDCLAQRVQLASAMSKSVPLAGVRSNALQQWDQEMAGVCLRSYNRGKADHCAELRRGLEAKRREGTQRDIVELLEREYVRICS